ncbi:hypothetical protein PIB30_073731, partial [Stylosanthes scabra]|nr:hypothetical protein [Stylosanthes scabra]
EVLYESNNVVFAVPSPSIQTPLSLQKLPHALTPLTPRHCSIRSLQKQVNHRKPTVHHCDAASVAHWSWRFQFLTRDRRHHSRYTPLIFQIFQQGSINYIRKVQGKFPECVKVSWLISVILL